MVVKRNKRVLSVCVAFACFFCMFLSAQADDKKPYDVITTPEIKALLDSKAHVILIDTRNAEEYNDAHIPGAINIPYKSFYQHKRLLPEELTTRLVFYCNGFK